MKKTKLLTITLSVMLTVALTACISIPLTTEKDDVTATDSIAVSADETRTNILVAGCDRASGLTDVIMLVSVDTKNNTASVMQIPRDTYAAYTENSYKKLNGAYGALGAKGLCELLSDSLGVDIDSYLVLSPDALRDAVDAIGGVEITLESPMYYSDPEQGLYISLRAGKQTLDGKTAEQFIRYRSGYVDGDLGRIDAQKVFLCGLIESARKNADALTVARVIAALLGKTDTNVTPADGAALAETLLKIENENVFFMTAPGEAVVAEESGASYYSLSGKAMEEALAKYFGAGAGSFDRERLFLNKRYDSFRRIYEGYSPYEVYTAKNIADGKAVFESIAQIPK
ncbi:MAG: LCP family protein [Clostridia bacterium]|nr:LCP family protein [Clostridia bacterium]